MLNIFVNTVIKLLTTSIIRVIIDAMKYQITVSGCDDSTSIEKELTDEQFKLVTEIADAITEASTYGCMPTMYVKLVEQGT